MFAGIGLGFLFEHIPAGTMIGIDLGFIDQQIFSSMLLHHLNRQ